MERARGKQDGEESVSARIIQLKTFTTHSCPPLRYSLQPEPNCFTSYNTRKGLRSLSLCAIVLRSSPSSHVSTCNSQRSSQLFCVHYTYYSGRCPASYFVPNRNFRLAPSKGPNWIGTFPLSLFSYLKTEWDPVLKTCLGGKNKMLDNIHNNHVYYNTRTWTYME
jgi:hypothetical protein